MMNEEFIGVILSNAKNLRDVSTPLRSAQHDKPTLSYTILNILYFIFDKRRFKVLQ